MTTILSKLKPFATGVFILTLFLGITVASCTSDKKPANTENVESTVPESEEHPGSGDEHPSSEHPSGEHPSAGDEHPADSTQQEHPSN
jgi:hypothetical protein